MPLHTSLNELLEMAILIERTNEGVYRSLERRFSHCSSGAAWLRQFAMDEDAHARWLESMRESTRPRKLANLADPRMVTCAEKSLHSALAQAVETVRTLEGAYQLAWELEHSERNELFEFLIGQLAAPGAQESLRVGLRAHVQRFEKLPAEIATTEQRQNIPAN